MNKRSINLNKHICSWLCLFLLLMILPINVTAATADGGEQKTVRIGWFEDSYNITGENGERSGYGYEYQQSVAAYTGWKYDYVKASWSELLKMMQDGDKGLDIMSGVSYTPERAEKMLFSEFPMGEEKYYLYADVESTGISASDLSTLAGKRVGLLDGSIHATQFYEWESEHGLQLQHVPITGIEDAVEKLDNDEIDCLVSTETPQLVELGLSAIVSTGGSNIYFVIDKDRPDLKEELDNAMRLMEYDKPFYADELYSRYLSAESAAVLSTGEQAWLAEHGAIRIGWLRGDTGVSDVDGSSGEPVGVINDYVTFAEDCLGNGKLEFELTGFDTQEEEIQALKDGKIDMIFHFSQDPYAAEQNGFILSNTVMTANMAAVTTLKYFDENAENNVAIEKGNLLLKWYVTYNYPKWSITEYDSFKDAEKAVRKGDADCFIAESGQLADYIDDKKLHNVYLTQAGDTSFAVRLEDTVLMSILNKTLTTMPSTMLTGALAMYDNAARRVTVTDFIKDNLLAVAAALILLFMIILMTILASLRKSRAAEAMAKQAASESIELNKKLQESRHDLQTALMRAESASAAKTTFLNNMSHDIRTPMNAIVGITNLMEHEEGVSDKLHNYIQKVQLSSRHLLGLINDILDMSRIESSEVTLNEEPVSLAEQIGQIDSIIRAQTNEHEQTFHIYVNNIVHEYLICDGVRLRQIFLNLLSNAVKYTPNGGDISLELTELPCSLPDQARFVYAVTDNGYGMTPEFVERIFEPFTRAENSMTNKVQGTGLGMTITKNIVDLMGGEIKVESEMGKGSRFEVTVTLKIDKDAKYDVGAESVLLVTDEERLTRNITAAASHSSVQLYTVSATEEAVAWLSDHSADVIMLSGSFINKDIAETVSTLRSISEHSLLVFCVDYLQNEHIHEILEDSGIDGTIPRPFFFSNLALAVARTRVNYASAPEKENDTILNGMNFLCAEDNELNAEILKEILNMYGASCTVYSDGKETVEAFKTVKPGEYDAILMDVQMPNMNGLEATRAIRSGENPLGKTIPIIAMTANAFSEDVQHCLGVGMDAHIAKPLDVAVLEKTLRVLIHHDSAHKE